MKYKFTLIELLVVIAVLGIISAIVVVNISGVNTKAKEVAVKQNQSNLQLAIDRYVLDNDGLLPATDEIDPEHPEMISFQKIYPAYITNYKVEKDTKYWLDSWGTVWASTADSPTNISVENGKLTWRSSEGVSSYKIYSLSSNAVTSDVAVNKNQKLKLLYQIKASELDEFLSQQTFDDELTYLISSVDAYGFETAPVGRDYTGYQNQPPVATIKMNPEENLLSSTTITWSQTSFDPDGDKIIKEEWKNKQSTYPTGEHTVSLRVQDEKGLWSDWVDKKIVVNNSKPVAVITMNPETAIYSNTTVQWDYKNSTDSDGDKIVNAEWENKQDKYSVGEYTVKLRVQDATGLWSDWTSKAFTVENRKPTPVIKMTPSTTIYKDTVITWDATGSFDLDGDTIANVEWKNQQSTYPIGQNTVELRVQDSRGLWSDWISKTFTVESKKPLAVITMTPSTTIYNNTMVTWSYASSTDPDGGTIVNAEWTNNLSKYPIGSNTVQLRVQNNAGVWSDWVSKTFTVDNRQPTAKITYTPSGTIYDNTSITWSSASSTDVDGDTIASVEWQVDSGTVKTTAPTGTLTSGSHTIKLRVKDSRGLWSDWVTQTITVQASTVTTTVGATTLSFGPDSRQYTLATVSIPSGAKNIKLTFNYTNDRFKFNLYRNDSIIFAAQNTWGSVYTEGYGITLLKATDQYEITGLAAGQSYTFKVEISNGNGYSTKDFTGFTLTYQK